MAKSSGIAPVSVPIGVTGIIVAVARSIVEIITQNAGGDSFNSGIIEQRAEPFTAIDGRDNHGPFRFIVYLIVHRRSGSRLQTHR